jgi:HAD superfamily hydrolase (TIGR01484 family)
LHDISCHYEEVIEPTIKVVFSHHDMAQMDALIQLLNNHPEANDFDFVRSEKHLYEILPKNVNKSVALREMTKILNIDIKNTVAAGDYNNDISMIKAAGIGYAVKNAVDDLKNIATGVIDMNDNDAVAKWLKENIGVIS